MTWLTGWQKMWRLSSGRLLACLVFAALPSLLWAQAGAVDTPPDRADIAATALLAVGIMLLLLEIKIISFGFLGLLGTVCLLFGVGVMWQNDRALWGVSAYYVIPLLLVILILTVMMIILTARAHKESVVSGREGYLGGIGEASEPLSPRGRVFFEGTYWTAESRAPVAKGEKVRIIGVDGLKLYVEPAGVEGSHFMINQGTAAGTTGDGRPAV